MKNHSLIIALKNLTGNPRGCVYTEPLWGIPFNLYSPYVSVYMLAIGLTDTQIGLILSISWGFQIVCALLSGVITDKLGRRRTSLIFEFFAWSFPALISAVAQNFWYFLAAGILNSVWRITMNSWTCLMVEDAKPEQLVDIYTWIYISNQIVGFAAPLAGVLISTFSLVPTVRGLYFFAVVMFTIKAVVTYWATEETTQGKIRLEETRHQSVFTVLGGYKDVVDNILHTPQTLYTGGIMLVVSISTLISSNFWAILVTEKLRVPAQYLAIFPFVKSVIILGFFFLVMPRINTRHYKLPLVAGFVVSILGQVVLITAPVQGYGFLALSLFLEACSYATIGPLVDQLTVLTIAPQERARIQSILYVGIILFTSPFGWIAGTLSSVNKILPFVLNIVLLMAGTLLAYRSGQTAPKELAAKVIIA